MATVSTSTVTPPAPKPTTQNVLTMSKAEIASILALKKGATKFVSGYVNIQTDQGSIQFTVAAGTS